MEDPIYCKRISGCFSVILSDLKAFSSRNRTVGVGNLSLGSISPLYKLFLAKHGELMPLRGYYNRNEVGITQRIIILNISFKMTSTFLARPDLCLTENACLQQKKKVRIERYGEGEGMLPTMMIFCFVL